MSIIFVDDNAVNLFVIEKTLKNTDFPSALFMGSAAELLSHLHMDEPEGKAVDVDLILLDIMMPEMDGIEACRIIRQDKRYQHVPILFITALDDKKKLAEALEAGGNDYITKPINRTELIARMKVALRLKKELDWHGEQEQNMKMELQLATQVQRSLLSKPIENDDLRIQVTYKPSSNLAGDMYYWEKIDEDRYGIMLFDMMGHGTPAALVCMYMSSVLRDSIDKFIEPTAVMKELNRYMMLLQENPEAISYYFTAIYMVINTKEKQISYVNAGHPCAYALIDGNRLEKLAPNSRPMGFFDDANVQETVISYTDSVQLIGFTDGLLEEIADDELQAEAILETKAYQKWQSPEALLKEIMPVNSRGQNDDLCVLLIHIDA